MPNDPTWCDGEGCLASCSVPDDPPPDPRRDSNAGWWLLLGAIVSVLVIDYILSRLHRPTASQKSQRYAKAHHWYRWIVGVIGVGGLFVWHMFF